MAAYRRVYDSRHLQAEGCYQFWCLVNRGTMGVNSLPKTVTRQNSGCDLNPGVSAPESSTLTTRLWRDPGGGGGGKCPIFIERTRCGLSVHSSDKFAH